MTIFLDPRFDALRNAIYHTERRAFLDLANRALSFITIVLGTAVVGKAVTLFNFRETTLEISVVIFATAQLVFDLGSRARTHEFLQRRYYEFLTELEDVDLNDINQQRRWSAKLVAISAEEPMPMRALDALAFNKALSSMNGDDEYVRSNRLFVTWIQRRLRHFWAFHSAEFPQEITIQKSKPS